jgi:hypothetical protein
MLDRIPFLLEDALRKMQKIMATHPSRSWMDHESSTMSSSLSSLSDDDDDDNNTLRLISNLYNDCNNCVQMAPSSIIISSNNNADAGMGLFATHDIPNNTICSLYPVHAMGVNNLNLTDTDVPHGHGYGSSLWITSTDPIDQDYFFPAVDQEEEQQQRTRPNYSVCLLGTRPPEHEFWRCGFSPFVDANPNRRLIVGKEYDQEKGGGGPWQGQLVNDGAALLTTVGGDGTATSTSTSSTTERAIVEYLHASLQAANCALIPFGPSPLLAVATTRPVQKGEELFLSYGVSYWLDAALVDDDDDDAVSGGAEETSITSSNTNRRMETGTTTKTGAIRALEQASADVLRWSIRVVNAKYKDQALAFQSIFDNDKAVSTTTTTDQ